MNIVELRNCPCCEKEIEVEVGHKFPIYICEKCNCKTIKVTRKKDEKQNKI